MAYATLADMRALLPENITIGDTVVSTPQNPNRDTISTTVANQFLMYATQFVDSKLAPYYKTPVQRVIEATCSIVANMLPGSQDVMVNDITPFIPGSYVRLRDSNGRERAVIWRIPELFDEGLGSMPNMRHLTLTQPTVNAYDSGSGAVIELISYPAPVTPMTAKFAVSFMFDKLFTADNSPDISNYGKALRNSAREDLDAIMAGMAILKGQEFLGKRFARYQIFDTRKNPAEYTPGQNKE